MIDLFIIIFICCIITAAFLISKFLKRNNNNTVENALKELNNNNFQIADIKFLQSSVGVARATTGITVNAKMYISDNVIFIHAHQFFYLNLPLIIVKDFAIKIPQGVTIINPNKLYITSWNAICVEFSQMPYSTSKITINLCNKSDQALLAEIKKWCI